MIKNVRLRSAVSLILNIAMAVLVAFAVGYFFTEAGLQSGVGNMESGGVHCFMFFTIDSNILAALAALLTAFFNLKALISGREAFPRWALLLKFAGTVAVSLTFFVVLVFLGPLMGFASAYEGSCFELHLTCPLMAVISFCFFEHGFPVSKKQALLGVLPTLIYGAVYLSNVIFLKIWPDFYYFNMGGLWYVSCILLPAVTYLLALALAALHNAQIKSA